MKERKCLFTVTAALALALALALAGPAAAADTGKDLASAYKAGKPLPLASQQQARLDEAGAYQVQAAYVAALVAGGEKPAGLKAGLTSKPAQDKFKAPGPVWGVLMESMRLAPDGQGGPVGRAGYGRMMIEVEIGYILNQDITQPISAEKAPAYVDKVAPVVELPDLNFADMKSITWQDIAAGNVGPRGFIVGQARPLGDMSVNDVTGQLVMNGKAMGPAAPGRAALGDQWKALAWTVNSALKAGQKVSKGMLVITGSLGPMFPAKPGEYEARYTGGLESLKFTVQ